MTDSLSIPTTRVRIATHMTASRFLHVEDALGVGTGKLRLFAGTYRRGHGTEMDGLTFHFVDLADARVIFTALAQGEPDFSYREYKGTPPRTRPERSPGNGFAGNAVSRVLSIAVKGDNVYVELKSGPGKLTATGAVTPDGKPRVEVNVGFKRYEAQRLAATVLAYIHAWDVHRIMTHQQLVGRPAPYVLTATTAAVANNIADAGTISSSFVHATDDADPDYMQAAPAASLRAETVGGNRPVARKDLVPGVNGVQVATPAQPATSAAIEATAEAIYGPGDLRYGDGSTVNENNSIELQTFRRFMAEKQTRPASRPALQAYYRQHVALN